MQVLELDGLSPVPTDATAAALREAALRAMDADRLVALAEISLSLALRHGPSTDLGWQHATIAAIASWAALFGAAADLSPFQDRATLARHLHNASLAIVTLGIPDIVGSAGAEIRRPLFDREIVIRYSWDAAPWPPGSFARFVAVDDFEVNGFRNRHRQSGVGAALLGDRLPIDPVTAPPNLHRLPPTNQAVALTAVLREVRFAGDKGRAPEQIDLAILDPSRASTVRIAEHDVPLESDFSAALADTLARTESLRRAGIGGVLRVRDWEEIGGLYMLEPFDPARVPVIFIHGLFSTPLTWREMANDLWSDPEIRERFQFWFYFYPTGQPFGLTAASLRAALADVRRRCDPNDTCRSLDRMVIVGHSMGGLVARLLVTEPGTALWDSLSSVPLDELSLSPEDHELVTRAVFSPPVDGVTRVVFIAVPHRGSDMADRAPARFLSRVVQLPPTIVDAAVRILPAESVAGGRPIPRTISNGVDSLSPRSAFLRALADLPMAPGVTTHSIIGDRSSTPGPDGTDGVVPFSSSRLECAESELVIPNADHSVPLHREAIREVRRILLEHAPPRPASAPSSAPLERDRPVTPP